MAGREILTVAQMQAAEQVLIDLGISVKSLMKVAGEGAAEWVWRVAAGRSVTVLCGPGNNGGDGYVIAESLRRRGLAVMVVAPAEPKTDAARDARSAYEGKVLTSGNGARGDVFVDCLFGSGLSRPLSGEHAVMLRDLAQRHSVCIAVDLPSGIESDSGALLNEKLPHYDLSLALGAWKFAHWRLPARTMMGQLRVVELGVQPTGGAAQLVSRPTLTAPSVDAHKYRRGHCAVVGGAMPGAALLACEAAQRAGAGYVKLLSDLPHPSALAGLVVQAGELSEALADSRIDAMLVGPGLGRDEFAIARLSDTLAVGRPCVLDADALVLLKPDMLKEAHAIVATPHDGEMDQLCRSFSVVASGRHDRATALAKVSGMVILAKGPDTLVASPDGRIAVAPPASSWLSIAGTGDVLAGIVASRLATGRDPFEAACQAVWLHGEAARQAGQAFTADELAQSVSGAIAAAL